LSFLVLRTQHQVVFEQYLCLVWTGKAKPTRIAAIDLSDFIGFAFNHTSSALYAVSFLCAFEGILLEKEGGIFALGTAIDSCVTERIVASGMIDHRKRSITTCCCERLKHEMTALLVACGLIERVFSCIGSIIKKEVSI
jgi:hypothetical protein